MDYVTFKQISLRVVIDVIVLVLFNLHCCYKCISQDLWN